ncbi:MAG: type II secretion system protein, partial [Planctomycetota bacterium]
MPSLHHRNDDARRRHRVSPPAANRSGFTLVEILVVIAVIGVLTGTFISYLGNVQTDARKNRTQRQIDTVNQVIMGSMGELNLSPMRLNGTPGIPVANRNFSIGVQRQRPSVGLARMLLRRDRMRMAFPDRKTDLLYPPARINSGTSFAKVKPPRTWLKMRSLLGLPAFDELPATVAVREGQMNAGEPFEALATLVNVTTNDSGGSAAAADINLLDESNATNDAILPYYWTRENEASECLYLILSAIDYNGAPAIESLGRSHIQNTDGDLVPEVVDAWDQPIQFVRWPAGFLPEMGRVTGRDQMDFLRKDFRFHDGDTTSNPVNLPPLIVSAGDDGVFDLLLNERFYALDSDGDADAGSNEN